jgi:hypothetical protein
MDDTAGEKAVIGSLAARAEYRRVFRGRRSSEGLFDL